MTEYMTEQEQIEQLKKWFKENGLTIIAAIVVAFVIVSGWHYWQNRHAKIFAHAAGIYDEMLTLRTQNNAEGTFVQAGRLLSHYPATPYASLAALMLARDAVLKKNYPEAKKQLNWIISQGNNPAIRQIAKLRLARISIAEKKPEMALDILKQIEDKNFSGLIAEIKGDAYSLMQDTSKAKESYQFALKELPKEGVNQRPLLQMKLDNLATASDIS